MQGFESLVDDLTSKGSNGIPAISVLIKDKSNSTILSKVSGHLTTSPDSSPIDAHAIFRLSSSTKLFTAIAALQCVERGLISLDEPIHSVLSEFKDKSIISLSTDNASPANPEFEFIQAEAPITLRRLLTHTSGIGYDMIDPRLVAWRKSRGEAPKSISGYATGMFDAPLIFEPGSSWIYGARYDAVGVLVSRLNGDMGLEAYMQKNIFDVLSLQSPTFFLRRKDGGQGMQKLVQCVSRAKDGTLAEYASETNDDAAEEQGSGGLYCSVPDFVSVMVDILQDEPKLLKRETADLLYTAQLEEGSPELAGFEAANWLWGSLASSGGATTQKVNHSVGGLLTEEEGTQKGAGKLQWAGGMGTLWIIDRAKGVAAFLATQIVPPFDPKLTELSAAFAKVVHGLDRVS